MRYFLQNPYLFFNTLFCCFDSPLPIQSKEVKSMELIMFLVVTYYFNIGMLLKMYNVYYQIGT